MCGICGIFDFKGDLIDRNLLSRMTRIMEHRGPDGEGTYVGEGVGLGHRRLSIIDIGGGAQPLSNEDGKLQIVFNGEIYNYMELRADLLGRGHLFKTRSDTEVIIHGYEEWGTDCVNKFNGIFAFALWDDKAKRLFLARDQLGVKPLYYVVVGNILLFASEIKSLLQDSDCSREVDIKSLLELFTFRYVPSPNTLFAGIKKLPPAHSAICSGDGMQLRKYWNWVPQIIEDYDEAQLVEKYRELLQDAVRLQLRSDVPVGLFLSSGIDSGALLALMREQTNGSIHTFTIGFEGGEKSNETQDARQIAQRFSADHTEMIVGATDYEKYYEHYLWNIEEPVGNETAAAFYFVSQIAGEKVKVALTGQGADEPWAGYHRYIGVRLSSVYSRFPSAFRNTLKSIATNFSKNQRFKRGVASLDEEDILTRFTKIYSFYTQEMKDQLFQPWITNELDTNGYTPSDALKPLQSSVAQLDALAQMLYIDVRASLPDDLLMVNDKTSMANSIESRVPFLDYRLVEFIESLPSHLKLKGFKGKYLHKKAVEKWLPPAIINAKKKGFDNPIDEWLRGKMKNYVEEMLLSERSAVARYFNSGYIKELSRKHADRKEDYLRHLYLLISFELWHQQFIHN